MDHPFRYRLFILSPIILLLVSGCSFATPSAPDTSSSAVSAVTPSKGSSRYLAYSPSQFEAMKDKKRVLFFHATWCPECHETNEELMDNPDKIPEDVRIFKTDYDSETALKAKYGVTYQHTFVLVDSAGNKLAIWNSGGLSGILDHVK